MPASPSAPTVYDNLRHKTPTRVTRESKDLLWQRSNIDVLAFATEEQ